MLMSPPYYVPEDLATQIAPVFAEAMLAHFAGDEIISAEANAAIQSVSEISPIWLVSFWVYILICHQKTMRWKWI